MLIAYHNQNEAEHQCASLKVDAIPAHDTSNGFCCPNHTFADDDEPQQTQALSDVCSLERELLPDARDAQNPDKLDDNEGI